MKIFAHGALSDRSQKCITAKSIFKNSIISDNECSKLQYREEVVGVTLTKSVKTCIDFLRQFRYGYL